MAQEAILISPVKNAPSKMRIAAVQSRKKEEKADEEEAENKPKEEDGSKLDLPIESREIEDDVVMTKMDEHSAPEEIEPASPNDTV